LSSLNNLSGNNTFLNTYMYRFTSGQFWNTTSTRIQHTVDSTYKGYIEFNPSGYENGIAIKSYNSSTIPGATTPGGIIVTGSGNTIVRGSLDVSSTVYLASSVGIGTQNPQYILDVSGIGRFGTFSGDYRSGSTNNAQLLISGNATGTYASDNGQLIITGSSNTDLRLGLMVDTTNNVTKIQSASSGSSNQITLSLNPDGGNVGIGTTSPGYKLDVNNTSRLSGNTYLATSSNTNVGIGTTSPSSSYKLDVLGNANISGYIRPSAGSGNNGIIFPNDPGGGTGDQAWIKYYARSGEDCTLEIGTNNDNTDHIYLNPSGNVGIGTATPGYKLDVNNGGSRTFTGGSEFTVANDGGSFSYGAFKNGAGCQVFWNRPNTGFGRTCFLNGAQGGGGGIEFYQCNSDTTTPVRADVYAGKVYATDFINASDYRLKSNITKINDNYTVDNLKPVEYDINNIHNFGLLAHELQEVLPCLVTGEKDGDQMQSVNYTGLIPILIKEIQDLKKEVKILKEKVSIIEK
jgi:hypothetical protein